MELGRGRAASALRARTILLEVSSVMRPDGTKKKEAVAERMRDGKRGVGWMSDLGSVIQMRTNGLRQKEKNVVKSVLRTRVRESGRMLV